MARYGQGSVWRRPQTLSRPYRGVLGRTKAYAARHRATEPHSVPESGSRTRAHTGTKATRSVIFRISMVLELCGGLCTAPYAPVRLGTAGEVGHPNTLPRPYRAVPGRTGPYTAPHRAPEPLKILKFTDLEALCGPSSGTLILRSGALWRAG